jgi:hypothetical protein
VNASPALAGLDVSKGETMQKKEFIATWKRKRTAWLEEAYKGQPHGPALLAASLVDLDKDGEKLWRKHRHAFKDESIETLEALLADKKDVGRVAS